MEKEKDFILTGTENNSFRHRYSFKKNNKIKKALEKLFLKLNLVNKNNEALVKQIFIEKFEDEEGREIYFQRKIEEIIDEVYYFKNDDFEVDIFFGSNKIIVLIRSKKRRDFVDFLEKNSSWTSDEEVEKIRKEKQARLEEKFEMKNIKVRKDD